jgi:hypothetical protein
MVSHENQIESVNHAFTLDDTQRPPMFITSLNDLYSLVYSLLIQFIHEHISFVNNTCNSSTCF